MSVISIKEMLEAGVHFGHQTSRFNPKMAEYIHTERNNVHIIDLQKTEEKINEACHVVSKVASCGGKVLFVGTKEQAKDSIKEEADRCGMQYVNNSWVEGTLVNIGNIQIIECLPDVLFVVDPETERNAIEEAHELGIPVVAIVDTNGNPEDVDYIIPGNDDAIRAIKFITGKIADAIIESKYQ